MAIITISRELAALGDETAREFARLSGCRLIDRKCIEQKIMEHGVSNEALKKLDERKLGVFSSLPPNRDDYLHYLKTAILDEAQTGNCVFIGRGAFAVLKGLPAVLPVFLVSTREARVERVRGYFRCDEKKALEIITRSDTDRAGFHRFFFEIKWRDSANYKLTLNTACLTPAACAELMFKALSFTAAPEDEAATEKKLTELRLAGRVVHHIVYERAISIQFLDALVQPDGSTVTLYGVAGSAALAGAAREAALEVSGVKQAVSEIQILQDTALFH